VPSSLRETRLSEIFKDMSTMMRTEFLGTEKNKQDVAVEWRLSPMPKIKNPTDVIARVHKTTICGTDLHILGGNVPLAQPGLGLGHEGLIDIIEVGSEVTKFAVGDRVVCCCVTACGKCQMCKEKHHGNCADEDGSWKLGHLIDGMQAQYVRVPHADHSCYKLPKSVPRNTREEDKYLMLADILPTSYEIGLVDGDMADNKTLAIVGCGPVGLAAILCGCAMYKPKEVIAIDLNEDRLELAKTLGATHSIVPGSGNNALADIKSKIDVICAGAEGVDVVVEAVGLPGGWNICQEIVKPGGNIAVLGVHGSPVTLKLEKMWYRNFKLTAGMMHGFSIQALMDKIEDGSLRADLLITHYFELSQIKEAYTLFNSRKDGALKMLLTNTDPADSLARQEPFRCKDSDADSSTPSDLE